MTCDAEWKTFIQVNIYGRTLQEKSQQGIVLETIFTSAEPSNQSTRCSIEDFDYEDGLSDSHSFPANETMELEDARGIQMRTQDDVEDMLDLEDLRISAEDVVLMSEEREQKPLEDAENPEDVTEIQNPEEDVIRNSFDLVDDGDDEEAKRKLRTKVERKKKTSEAEKQRTMKDLPKIDYPKSLAMWSKNPEYAELCRFIIEKTKKCKKKLKMRALCREFKEISGSKRADDCLISRVRTFRKVCHELPHLDTETKVELLFGLGVRIDTEFYNMLITKYRVILDQRGLIKEFKSEKLHLLREDSDEEESGEEESDVESEEEDGSNSVRGPRIRKRKASNRSNALKKNEKRRKDETDEDEPAEEFTSLELMAELFNHFTGILNLPILSDLRKKIDAKLAELRCDTRRRTIGMKKIEKRLGDFLKFDRKCSLEEDDASISLESVFVHLLYSLSNMETPVFTEFQRALKIQIEKLCDRDKYVPISEIRKCLERITNLVSTSSSKNNDTDYCVNFLFVNFNCL